MCGCKRCYVILCTNCYNIVYEYGKVHINWNDPDFKHPDFDKYHELMKKYNKTDGLNDDYLCKHICYYSDSD